MSKPDEEQLLNEAADIFLRLQEAPDDPAAKAVRDRFLSRGEAERRAYAKIKRTWKVSGAAMRPPKTNIVLALILLAAATYFILPEARTFLLADFRTGNQAERVALVSGDLVDMDAATALVDNTKSGDRDVQLLRGAAFFKVAKNRRPFKVNLDEITVEVLGTSFETAKVDNEIWVSVFEGVVKVTAGQRQWQLTQGQNLVWRDDGGATVSAIETGRIASWRTSLFVADATPFEQVAAVISRRLPGTIIIPSEALANTEVTGTFDLSQPETALRALAATRGANVLSASPLISIILAP
ncbi:MAG: FecR domain-containing protein [Pseudomonadota bacterium]